MCGPHTRKTIELSEPQSQYLTAIKTNIKCENSSVSVWKRRRSQTPASPQQRLLCFLRPSRPSVAQQTNLHILKSGRSFFFLLLFCFCFLYFAFPFSAWLQFGCYNSIARICFLYATEHTHTQHTHTRSTHTPQRVRKCLWNAAFEREEWIEVACTAISSSQIAHTAFGAAYQHRRCHSGNWFACPWMFGISLSPSPIMTPHRWCASADPFYFVLFFIRSPLFFFCYVFLICLWIQFLLLLLLSVLLPLE